MTSRSETTHLTRVSRVATDNDIYKKRNFALRQSQYLSHETLSDCHVSHKAAVLMMMDSCVSEREVKFDSSKMFRELR